VLPLDVLANVSLGVIRIPQLAGDKDFFSLNAKLLDG
jgi:hypothetical protein